tara:strand:- start:896 stop:1144 length:249 start_codon:yes stop_codon:yes gene_type:complete
MADKDKKDNPNEEVSLAHESHAPVYDLANRVCRSTVAVIDTMVQRGAVKGEELSTLGQLRDQSVQLIQMCETYQQDQAANSE